MTHRPKKMAGISCSEKDTEEKRTEAHGRERNGTESRHSALRNFSPRHPLLQNGITAFRNPGFPAVASPLPVTVNYLTHDTRT